MKRTGIFMLIFGSYLFVFAVFKLEMELRLFPDRFDYLSDWVMLKYGIVIALFGLLTVLALALGNAVSRMRKALSPRDTNQG